MKNYGANKATEFSKKQISVIYGMAKRGELKVEKWVISDLYDLADYYGYDDNGTVEYAEREVKSILESVFAGDVESAQTKIDAYTEKHFNLLSIKYQKKANRDFVAQFKSKGSGILYYERRTSDAGEHYFICTNDEIEVEEKSVLNKYTQEEKQSLIVAYKDAFNDGYNELKYIGAELYEEWDCEIAVMRRYAYLSAPAGSVEYQ